jgi:hypothetical protein
MAVLSESGEGTTMLQKRTDDDEAIERGQGLTEYETARSAAESSGAKPIEPKKDEEHVSMFWRIFGGTILSIVALVTITLYNNLTTSISDLRSEVSREREARAELIKKDEYNNRITAVYERMRGIDALKVELEGQKEKISTGAAAVDGAKRDAAASVDAVKKEFAASTDAMKKDAAAVEVLKERVAALESVKKDIAGLDVLKEKLATVTADLKAVRDDLMKVSVEVDRNKASDLERKSSRDTQTKQIDEALKELQKGLQDCREKLARLEGAQPKPGDLAIPFVRPAGPGTVKPSEVKPAGGSTPPGGSKPGPEEPDGK